MHKMEDEHSLVVHMRTSSKWIPRPKKRCFHYRGKSNFWPGIVSFAGPKLWPRWPVTVTICTYSLTLRKKRRAMPGTKRNNYMYNPQKHGYFRKVTSLLAR